MSSPLSHLVPRLSLTLQDGGWQQVSATTQMSPALGFDDFSA